MAVTVTANLTDITLGEAGDDTYWTGEDGNSTEVYRQGSASQAWIVAKNGNETASFDAYSSNANATFDLSGTGVHLYITMKCDIAPYIDYVHIGLQSDTAHGSTTSGTDYWTIVDNTTNTEWGGEWRTFILDVNSTTTFSTTGTLDLSAITDVHVNVDNSNSGNIRSIENTYIDVIRFGTGLTMTGTLWDWDDVATVDSNSSNKYDILRKVGPGVYEVNGQLAIGNGATTTTPDSSNEVLFFKDPSTSGEAGGALGKIASGFYKMTFQGSGLAGDFSNASVIASSNYPFIFDADDTNLGTDAVVWNGGVIIEASSATMYTGSDYQNMSWVNCGQIAPQLATFETHSISGYTGTDGAVLWPSDDTNISNLTFSICDNDIEYDATSDSTAPTFTNIVHDDNAGDFDVNNTSGGAVTISLTGTSNGNSYNTGGSTVTFSNNVSVTLDGLPTGGVEVRIYDDTGTSGNPIAGTEIDGNENVTSGSFTFADAASNDVIIVIFDEEYTRDGVYLQYQIPTSDATIPFTLLEDRNYLNP